MSRIRKTKTPKQLKKVKTGLYVIFNSVRQEQCFVASEKRPSRKGVLRICLEEWGWDEQRVEEFGNPIEVFPVKAYTNG